MDTSEDRRLFVLAADEPSVNVPATIVMAQRIRNAWRRYADAQRKEERHTMVPRSPTRVFIADVFMRDDVYPGCEPVVTTHM